MDFLSEGFPSRIRWSCCYFVMGFASLTGDAFPKIIVRHDIRKRWYDDSGVLNIGILDFLLDDSLV